MVSPAGFNLCRDGVDIGRRACRKNWRFSRLGICRGQESARNAGDAISVVMCVVEGRARFFDVCARVRSLSTLEKWGEREQDLSDREEEESRPPQNFWKHA